MYESGKAAPGPDPKIGMFIGIGMFRPIRLDHTNCLQVAIKTHKRTLTNHHMQVWTKLDQSNGCICTRSSTVQPLKNTVFELIKESLSDFHLVSYLIDEVQIGSVDSVSKLWEDIFTTFPVDSRPIRFEYISHCILTAYTGNCDDVSTYYSRLSTVHTSRVALGNNTTIAVDDDVSQVERHGMMSGLA